MKSKVKIALFIALLFSLFYSFSHMENTGVQAQGTAGGKCYPLDLVILLDESQSMYERNDRDGRRFDAVGTIIDYLGNHAVFLCREEGIQHRISVIGFGDQAVAALDGPHNNYEDDIEIFLEPVVIPSQIISDKDIKEATSIWDSQRNAISIANSGTSLGATDHRSAFRAALDVLSRWESEKLGEQDVRRKAVILLTDGGSCVRNLGCNDSSQFRADANQLNRTAQTLMTELQEFLKPTGDYFPFYGSSDPESVFITAVFLSRNINMESLGTSDRWRQIALDHGGDLFHIESSTSLVATVNDALDPISGSGRTPVECGSPVWVRPYLDNVVIFSAYPLVENPSERAVVVIMDPANDSLYGLRGGTPITGSISTSNMIYHSYKGNETYIFNAPVPGAYQVFVGDADDCTDALSIKVDTASISSVVISPVPGLILPTVESAPFYSNYVNGFFALTVEDANGQPLKENPNYPLTVTAVVQNDDPSYEKTYTLTQKADGYYESEFIETPSPGTYRWEVMVTVPHPDPNEEPIKLTPENNRGRFTASPVELLSFTIETPSNNDVSALNRVQGITQIPEPLNIAVKVVDTAGDVDVTTIFDDWSNLFSAQLTDGTRVLETIDLEIDPTTKNRFIGQFSNGSINNLVQSGMHVVNVRANWGGTDNYDELAFTPALENASVVIEQYEIKPLQLELIAPQQAPLHQRDTLLKMFLKQNGLQPFSVSVRVVDPLNQNSPLFLKEVLSSLDSFEVVVQTPSGITQTITLAESSNVAEELLVGSGGQFLNESGEYTLSMRVNDSQLLEKYAWAQTAYEATFTRADSTYTSRTTWTAAQVVVGVIILIFIGWLIYIFSGGPTGSLVVIDTGTKAELVSLKLRKHRRVNKFKKSVFKGVGIKQITARKGYGNFVSVHVKQLDGHESPLDNMEPGDSFDVGEKGNVRYVNDHASTPSYDDFE